MKILFLSHRIPFPPNKGDKIRSFNEIRNLSGSYEIHLACLADNPRDLRYEKNLREICSKVSVYPLKSSIAKTRAIMAIILKKSLSVGYFYSSKLQKEIDSWISSNHYNAIFCFSSVMAEYLFRSVHAKELFNSNGRKTRLLMDFCDVDSHKWLQYAQNAAFPMNLIYRVENKRLLEYEKKINRIFDSSIFVTNQETDLFREQFPQAKNLCVVSNGVDHDFFSPSASIRPELKSDIVHPVLLFTGAMDYHANVDGVMWFSNEIFPLIQEKYPEAKFCIVGSNPDPKVLSLRDRTGIQVKGFVKDVRPYYQAADICVTPLRLARGIQNKVLEAMAMGKPVVATKEAFEGIEAAPGRELLVAGPEPEAFAEAILSLMKNKSFASQMGLNAREMIVQKYSWKKKLKKLDRLLQ